MLHRVSAVDRSVSLALFCRTTGVRNYSRGLDKQNVKIPKRAENKDKGAGAADQSGLRQGS